MLHKKQHITGFTEQGEEVIRFIASQPFLKQISSMRNCKGFPPRDQVAAFMTMPCLKEGWQQGNDEAVQHNPIDRNLLIRVASMNSRKGFPTEAHTSTFTRWLPLENKKRCLKIASRVFASSGLPEQSVLTANERTLRQRLPEYPIDSDDEISDSDNEQAEDQQIKILALFCSAPDKWRMNFAEFEQ